MPSLLLVSASLLCMAASGQAAAGLPDMPVKWQYAELSYVYIPARPAGTAADGTVVPGTPAKTTIRWITAEGEVVADGWADMADRLKAPAFKKEGSTNYQRVQVLNLLGREGWELVQHTEATTTTTRTAPHGTWTFKRRVP